MRTVRLHCDFIDKRLRLGIQKVYVDEHVQNRPERMAAFDECPFLRFSFGFFPRPPLTRSRVTLPRSRRTTTATTHVRVFYIIMYTSTRRYIIIQTTRLISGPRDLSWPRGVRNTIITFLLACLYRIN